MSKWTIEYYDKSLQDWIKELPVGIRADFAKLTELLEKNLEPYAYLILEQWVMVYLNYAPKGERELVGSSTVC